MKEEYMTIDPRYPIGRFIAPVAWDASLVALWRRQVAELPEQLEEAVIDLDDGQLDTRYRDGGWTVRQLVHHVADSHMNAYIRFKLALTEDVPVIKPYQEALWAEMPDSSLPVEPSLELLEGLHTRWAWLLGAMTPAQYARTWFHPDHNSKTPLWSGLGLYAWHGLHHTAHVAMLRARQGW
jgi:uncharacterized damage-inducible protein DinB